VAALLLALPLTAQAAVDVFSSEGNSGITQVQITIQSKTPANGTISGQWQTVDGTATVADNDYISASGDFIILSGQTQSQPITLQIVGDTKVEPDETFALNLFNINNGAQLDPGPYTIHIINDDAPAVTVSSPNVVEGNSGTTPMQFVVTLTTPAAVAVQASYVTGDGTAKAGEDYQADTGNLTFQPGETTKVVNINVIGDTKFELNETFTLTVTPNGGAPAVGTGTIVNDDAPGVTVSNASVVEGNSGITPMTFTVTLAALATASVQATYRTTDGTATAGQDYEAASGTITFAPGVLTQTITVNVIGDTLFEPDETFTLTVTPVGGVAATATGTIVNDDAAPLAALRIVSGNNQGARLGQTLPQPLVVEVVNAQGTVAPGVSVDWTVIKGAATLNPTTSTTNAQGRASTTATLNSVGEIDVQASVKGLPPVTFVFTSATQLEQHASGPVAVPIAHALDIVCAENDATFSAACRALSGLDDATLTSTLERVAPLQSGAESKVATEFVSQVTSAIQSRLRSLRGGAGRRFDVQRLSLGIGGRQSPIAMMSAAAPAQEQDYNGWSGFLSGNLGTGERIAGDGLLGFDLDTHGLMLGVDRQFGDAVVGLSANVMTLDSKLHQSAGKLDTNAYALSLYGSRMWGGAGSRPHLDGSLTLGRNHYDAEHVVDIPTLPLATSRSKNDADVYAASVVTGADLHSGRTDFDLTLGGTYSRTHIDDLTESGDSPLILFVNGHDIDSLTATAGLDIRSAFATSFGDLLPSVRGEIVHEFKSGARLVTAHFLRDALSTGFTVPVDRPDADYGKLSAGLQAVFAHGVSAFIEVTQDVLRSDLHFRTVQLNVSKSF
jgi:uncharacterized protein YhjY with autotransporter beta-barrel domain